MVFCLSFSLNREISMHQFYFLCIAYVLQLDVRVPYATMDLAQPSRSSEHFRESYPLQRQRDFKKEESQETKKRKWGLMLLSYLY